VGSSDGYRLRESNGGRRGGLGGGIVDAVFGGVFWPGRFGWRSGFNLPQTQVLEDLSYDIPLLYHADHLHLAGTFGQVNQFIPILLFPLPTGDICSPLFGT
jgi:hypothetical protein